MPKTVLRSLRRLALALPALVAACGGGSDGPPGASSCSVPDEQVFLSSYFDDNYFWYRLSPKPSPANFTTTAAYFAALLYRGGDAIPNGGGATWPSDRYSGFQSTESFNRFFGDGQTLSYGLAVAGLEVAGQPNAPLYVRYLEPAGPAAQAGVVRGERVMSLNGRLASDIITANDFSALTPNAAGDALDVVLRNALGRDRNVRLTAATFSLTPVQNGKVVQSQNGQTIGYVFVKDMISQVGSPLASAMTNFRNQGIQQLVLDLRYNGGGLVSTGATVASYGAGTRAIVNGVGQIYTQLLYNDKQSASNTRFDFSNPGAWAGFAKVYVLAGERTCSASEQVINGLRGVGVDAVLIGDTTCGKPVGFLPRDGGCGNTYSVVNFEGVNARNEGRYFNGLPPTCAVAEDFSKAIGALDDPLLVTAAAYVDGGACPVALSREAPSSRSTTGRARYSGADGGERSGMSAR